MVEKHLVVISVFVIFISLLSIPVESYEVSDPNFTNELIHDINTPSIEPGREKEMTVTIKNPYPEEMNTINFTVSIYWYSYLGVDKNISEVDEPPVFDDGKTYSILDIGDLPTNESQELEYIIRTSEKTKEGVYSIRFKLEFSINGIEEVMKSRGCFSSEEWEDAKSFDGGFNLTQLNVSGIIPESTFEVRDPIPRWPQYTLGLITIISGVLAVMFYMQEKYNSFPKLEKTFENWASKFKKFRSGLKKGFKKR